MIRKANIDKTYFVWSYLLALMLAELLPCRRAKFCVNAHFFCYISLMSINSLRIIFHTPPVDIKLTKR